jgi:hypothetical protein
MLGPIHPSSKAALNAITLAMMIELDSTEIKINLVSPAFTSTNLNGYAGTESVEDGSWEIVRVALLGPDGPTGTFTRWENETIAWRAVPRAGLRPTGISQGRGLETGHGWRVRSDPSAAMASSRALEQGSQGRRSRPLSGSKNPPHSTRSSNAVGVRAARRPGMAATTLASTRAPNAMRTTERTGTLGAGTTLI